MYNRTAKSFSWAHDALSCLARSALVARLLEATGQRLMDHFADEARAQGLSWTQVGVATGVSKQAAQKRFGRSDNAGPPIRWFITTPDEEVLTALGGLVRRVVMAAQATAAAQGRAADGEDVLLGVLRESRGGAAQALRTFAIDVDTVMAQLALRPPVVETVVEERGLAPAAVAALESSAARAKRLGAPVVGTGHVLLAVLAAGGRRAAALSQVGLTVPLLENWLKARPALE